MKIDKPGIYPDFPEVDYHADCCPQPSLNQSIVKVLVDQSTLHARTEHPRFAEPDDPEGETEKYVKAQAIGNAAHAILIGRGKTLAVGDFDAWTTKDAKEFKANAIKNGEVYILAKHLTIAHAMVKAATLQLNNAAAADPIMLDAFVKGDGEVVVAAEIDGIWLRSLIDWMVNPRVLIDYKSTGMSVAPRAIPNLMADAGWPIQAATQERILDVLDPEGAGRRRFFFIAQENYKPFALTVHELPEGTMTMGRKMLAKGEAMWREAILLNKWTGYPALIHHPQYPGYKESQWLARELEDEQTRAERIIGHPIKPGEAYPVTPKMLTELSGG